MEKKLVIFERESESKDIILGYLNDCKIIKVDKIFDKYSDGLKYVKTNKPQIAIFSMTEDKHSCLKMIKRLTDFGVNVIAISEDYTTSNIIQTLRYGAKDFVSKQKKKKDLLSAISKCSKEEVKTLKKAQIITIYSNKGGVGKTAVATNLAVELSKLTREKVALVDLNIPIGDIATFLDLKPTLNISDIINNSNPENKNFIMDACQQYKDTELYVLAEPPYIEQTKNLNPKQIIKLFELLRNSFSYIIIDMGANIDKLNMTILDNSDIILLTTVINLPLIRNCQRCLDLFESLKYTSSKIKIIVNRYLENDEITVDDVEKTLNKSVYWKVPNNYFTVMSSINKGIPVSEINEHSNVTESFVGLASKITDELFIEDIG